MDKVLILGANSDMAEATADLLVSKGCEVILAARDREKLDALVSDLRIRHEKSVHAAIFDAVDFSGHSSFYQSLPFQPDAVICFFGYLGDQKRGEEDWDEVRKIIDVNYTGAVSILNIVASDFKKRGSGCIVGVSSVAGERGRQSNYFYGSAKAALTAYLSGLRNSLFHYGCHVVTVKPGFVKTKMLGSLKTSPLMTASAVDVASAIYKSVKKRKNTVYVLKIWRLVILIIRNIPEQIFKRLKL